MKKNDFLIHRLNKRAARRRISFRRDFSLRGFFRFALMAAGVGFALLFLLFLFLLPTLPSVEDVTHLVAAQSSAIYDREGNILYTIHGDENRKIIPMDSISPHVVSATLAIEDDQFYEHGGLDFTAIARALFVNLTGGHRQGASTITQQFVKNAFLSPERTYIRKLKEAVLSIRLEQNFTKDEILEMYLNRIPYGSSIYGVELASQAFFDKPALELTIAEAAILAAIPKAPSYFSPFGSHRYAQINLAEEEIIRMDIHTEQDLFDANPQFITKGLLGRTYTFGEGGDQRTVYVRGRTDFVLDRMLELELILEEEKSAALLEANAIEFNEYREEITAPHFVMYIRELLEERYGKEQIEKGGLKITTTLDLDMQVAAEAAMEKYGENNAARYGASNASLLAVDPDTGHILAMMGSRDYWNDEIDGKVNVTLRPRLPGSSFKPIVYAAAFLKGYAPSTVLYDVKTKFGAWYEPENFDGEFIGPVSMRQGLAYSRNVPAVKAAYLAGIPNVIDLARKMGIQLNQPDDWYGLSLALGAGEARLMDMVLAYSVFANGGTKMEPVAILKIEDRHGNILEEYQVPEKRELTLDPQVAYLMNDVLSDVSARPEGWWRERLSIPGQINGAKTGTSNKRKKIEGFVPEGEDDEETLPFDAWTIGYTRNLAAGVWAGNNNGDHMKPTASGLDTAGGIWHDFMVVATKGKPSVPFEKPEGIRFIEVAKQSGKLPSDHTPEDAIVTGVFGNFGVPTEVDDSYQVVEIDKVSGKLATEFTPLPAREEKAYFRHHSILPDNPNWEEAVREWAEENDQDEEPPTEYDDVHTAESEDTKPEVKIVAPTADGIVSPPYVDVVLDIDSASGVAQIDFYWDDELVETLEEPPFRGRILVDDEAKKGSTHEIRAVVFDQNYHSSQSAIEVKIGEDSLPPEVQFTFPKAGQALSPGQFVTAQVDAYDPNGAVKKVEWFFDGSAKNITKNPPYLWSFVAPAEPGDYSLKAVAYDYADNPTASTIKVNVVDASDALTGDSRLLKPKKNATFDQGDSVVMQAYIDASIRADVKEVIALAKITKALPKEIAKTDGIDSSSYTFIWDAPTAGQYELFLKIVLENGKVRFTEKVPIVVR